MRAAVRSANQGKSVAVDLGYSIASEAELECFGVTRGMDVHFVVFVLVLGLQSGS